MPPTPTAARGGTIKPEPQTPLASRKRKQLASVHDHGGDATYDDDAPLKSLRQSMPGKARKSPKTKANIDSDSTTHEKRLRRFRQKPPQSYLNVKARALTQRLTVLSRERCGTDEVPEEKVVMAGSTGNVYTQHISLIPRCDCPHANKGNQCKHIIYVMLRVLKAREDVAYQLALTSSELRDMFRNASPIPNAHHASAHGEDGVEGKDSNRKPIEGECPICYTEFEPLNEEIVYCKAACGNNIHKNCMQSWLNAKRGKATCPYCRAGWEDLSFKGNLGSVDLQGATMGEDGYANIASQLGLSGVRDYSTYHQPWARQQFGGSWRQGRYG